MSSVESIPSCFVEALDLAPDNAPTFVGRIVIEEGAGDDMVLKCQVEGCTVSVLVSPDGDNAFNVLGDRSTIHRRAAQNCIKGALHG